MSDLERQISWVTRACSDTLRTAPRRLRPIAAAGAAGQPALAARRPGPRAAAPDAPRSSRSTATPISPATSRFPRPSRAAPAFRRPTFAATGRSCRSRWRIPASTQRHRRRDRPRLPVRIFDRRPGRQGRVCLCHRPAGDVLATSSTGPEIGKKLVEPAAGRRAAEARRRGAASGTDADGHSVLTTAASWCRSSAGTCSSNSRPPQALTPIRDQLVRDRAPDRARPHRRDHRRHHHGAAHAGADQRAARRRAASRRRRFRPPHRGQHQGRAGGAVRPVQQHGRAAQADLFRPRGQGRRAHARSRPVDQRAEGARRGRPRGRLLARPQRRAADRCLARAGDHACRRGADLRL